MVEHHIKNETEPRFHQAEDVVRKAMEEWQQSQERVLRYLKAIDVSPVRSLEIAHTTLKHVAADAASTNGIKEPPTRVAMRRLGQVLAESDLDIIPAPSRTLRPFAPPSLPPQLSRALPVMPDLNRGRMLPEMKPTRLFKNMIAFLISRKIGSM